MTPTALLRRIYNVYDSGYERRNAVFALHRRAIQSPRLTRLLFGVEVDRTFMRNGFFDLTTLLLREDLRRRLRRLSDPGIVEIGVGRFAVLSGWLSRRVKGRIVACDFDRIAYESARIHVRRNGLHIDVVRSDVLSGVPEGERELIFWNLPYYDDPEPILSRLFEAAPRYLSDRGTLILGFNGKPLPVARVMEILARYPALEIERVRSYWWNLHALVAIRRTAA